MSDVGGEGAQRLDDGVVGRELEAVEEALRVVATEVGRQLPGEVGEPQHAEQDARPGEDEQRPLALAGRGDGVGVTAASCPVSALPRKSTSRSVVGAITAAARASRKSRSSGSWLGVGGSAADAASPRR